MSREAFIKSLSHSRKIELANMILDDASVEDMKNAGFGRINILEMARKISADVEGKEDFSLDIPNDEAETVGEKKESASDTATSDNANQESASSTQNDANDGDAKESIDGKVETLGGNPVGTTTGEEDAEKIAENVADEEKVNQNDGGAHDTETLGGNPQTSTTGQEDADKLNENAN